MGSFDFTFSRRCIAVDLGQSRIKAILAERKGRRLEVLHAFTLDLQEEGLLTQEETNRHISRILLEMGNYPVSLAIPQHVAVSHLIALPSDGKARRARLIEDETQKLTGLSESTIVYDYFRLKPSPRIRNPIWVTVSREKELEDQINRLVDTGLAVGEVTNAGNALASAYLATQPAEERVVLADIGGTTTTVVVLERSQPVFASTFPLGGELFTETIAASRQISFDEAETIKKTESVFSTKEKYPEFIQVVERWHQEFRRVLAEALKEPGQVDEEPLKVVLSGGSSLQPGLLEFLQEDTSHEYYHWRDSTKGVDSQTYAVAYGTALAGLRVAPVRCSLLPRRMRQERFRSVQVALLNAVAALMMIGLFILLLADSSVKRENIREKMSWIRDFEEAHAQTETVEELLAARSREYRRIVPIVQQQKRTRDLLETLVLMQEVRSEHDAWFVLLADGRSYVDRGALPPGDGIERETEPRRRARSNGEENPNEEPEASPADWNRFVVELSVPGSDRESHEVVREVVNSFGSGGIFRNVDTLADIERVEIVDEEVILPEQTFSLNLELIPSQLSLPAEETESGPLLSR